MTFRQGEEFPPDACAERDEQGTSREADRAIEGPDAGGN